MYAYDYMCSIQCIHICPVMKWDGTKRNPRCPVAEKPSLDTCRRRQTSSRSRLRCRDWCRKLLGFHPFYRQRERERESHADVGSISRWNAYMHAHTFHHAHTPRIYQLLFPEKAWTVRRCPAPKPLYAHFWPALQAIFWGPVLRGHCGDAFPMETGTVACWKKKLPSGKPRVCFWKWPYL